MEPLNVLLCKKMEHSQGRAHQIEIESAVSRYLNAPSQMLAGGRLSCNFVRTAASVRGGKSVHTPAFDSMTGESITIINRRAPVRPKNQAISLMQTLCIVGQVVKSLF